MTEAEKLLKTVQQYSPKASISSKNDSMGVRTDVIEIPCRLAGNSVPLRIFVESHDFQILLGELLSFDKIEGVEIFAKDVEALVVDALTAIKGKKVTVCKYNFLGKKKYSVSLEGHTPYETFSEVLIKRLGKKTQLGLLEPAD